MGKTLKVDGTEYELDKLSNEGKITINLITYTEKRIVELTNFQAVLKRAKKSYIKGIKREILANKAGFLLNED
jgi:hypothetical protein